jgi:hypothetical protein
VSARPETAVVENDNGAVAIGAGLGGAAAPSLITTPTRTHWWPHGVLPLCPVLAAGCAVKTTEALPVDPVYRVRPAAAPQPSGARPCGVAAHSETITVACRGNPFTVTCNGWPPTSPVLGETTNDGEAAVALLVPAELARGEPFGGVFPPEPHPAATSITDAMTTHSRPTPRRRSGRRQRSA